VALGNLSSQNVSLAGSLTGIHQSDTHRVRTLLNHRWKKLMGTACELWNEFFKSGQRHRTTAYIDNRYVN